MVFTRWLAGGLLALPAAMALDWSNRSIEVHVAPLQAEVTVEFPFVNRGDRPVTIRSIHPNCSCLEAEADKTTYASGEAGLLTAVFSVGDRIGSYDRAITVETDEGGQPVKLTARFDVPPAAEVTPRNAQWRLQAEPTPATLEVLVADGLHLEFTRATATSEQFGVTLETIETGRRYKLLVKPTTTATAAVGAIRISGKSSAGHEIVVSAYVSIR